MSQFNTVVGRLASPNASEFRGHETPRGTRPSSPIGRSLHRDAIARIRSGCALIPRGTLLVHSLHPPPPPTSMNSRQSTAAVLSLRRPRRAIYLALAMLFGALWYLFQPLISEIDASESWPSTSGMVLSSVVVERNSSEGAWYSPEVEFEYTVDGATYTAVDAPIFGTHIDLGSRTAAQKIIDQYPPGRAVAVYYHPRWPSVALLIRDSGLPATPKYVLMAQAIYCLPPVGFVAFLALFAWDVYSSVRRGSAG